MATAKHCSLYSNASAQASETNDIKANKFRPCPVERGSFSMRPTRTARERFLDWLFDDLWQALTRIHTHYTRRLSSRRLPRALSQVRWPRQRADPATAIRGVGHRTEASPQQHRELALCLRRGIHCGTLTPGTSFATNSMMLSGTRLVMKSGNEATKKKSGALLRTSPFVARNWPVSLTSANSAHSETGARVGGRMVRLVRRAKTMNSEMRSARAMPSPVLSARMASIRASTSFSHSRNKRLASAEPVFAKAKNFAGCTVWDDDCRGFGVRRQVRDASYVLKVRVHGRQRF
jgi:hypothetical protein